MTIVSISMPETLRDTVDQYAETHGYGGRSEVVRKALQEFCAHRPGSTNARSATDTVRCRLATLVVCFAYGDASVEQQVATIRRETDCVVAHTHGHAAGRCLEIIVVYGTHSQRQQLTASLRAVSGVDSVEQSVATLQPENSHSPTNADT